MILKGKQLPIGLSFHMEQILYRDWALVMMGYFFSMRMDLSLNHPCQLIFHPSPLPPPIENENSPALQRWVPGAKTIRVPEGTADISIVPDGTLLLGRKTTQP
jgi:hypothetical protein